MASSPMTPRSKRKASEPADGEPAAKKRSAKAKAKPKAKAEVCPCIMPGCDEDRYRRLRFCTLHRYSVDNMKSQAEEKGTIGVYEEAMKDDSTTIEIIQEWEEINPPGKKWRKKAVLNWGRFQQRFGNSRREGETGKKRKMDKREFGCYGKYKKGWMPEEIEEEWTSRKADLTIDRDWNGKNGALRLEIDKGIDKHSTREKFLESASVEESDSIKNPNQQDLEALRYHSNSASNSKGAAAFLRSKWSMDWEEKKAKDEDKSEDEDENDGASDDIENVDAVKRAGAFAKAEDGLNKMVENFMTVMKSACERLDSVPAVEAELGSFTGDVAFHSYVATSTFRLKIGLVFLGHASSQALMTQPLAIKDGAVDAALEAATKADEKAAGSQAAADSKGGDAQASKTAADADKASAPKADEKAADLQTADDSLRGDAQGSKTAADAEQAATIDTLCAELEAPLAAMEAVIK